MVAQVTVVADSEQVALLFVGIVLGLIGGVRIGGWYYLRKLGKYEYRNRRSHIKDTPWNGGG